MKQIKSVVVISMTLGAWLITAPEAARGAGQTERAPRDPVKFARPKFVDPPQVLFDGAGDGRCPDPSQPCLKAVDDLLFGRTRILPADDLVIGYQGGRALLLTQDSGVSNVDLQTLNDGSAGFTQPAVVGARMFNTASDAAVTLVADRNNNILQWRLDRSLDIVASGVVSLPVSISDRRSFLSVVAGDFTGDGLDEIVVFLTAVGANGAAIVATALDPNDPIKGLKFGPVEQFHGPPFQPQPNHLEPLKVTKATVLGQPRVFVAGPTNYLANQCPTLHSGLSFESYTINLQSLALSSVGTFVANLPEGNNSCLHFVDITAGRFSTGARDQLLVAYSVEGGNVKVLPFDFNAQGIAV